MTFLERLTDSISSLILIATGLLGLIIGLADLFGKDLAQFPLIQWFKEPAPLTLLIVAGLAMATGLERFVRFGRIDRQISNLEELAKLSPDRIINALNGSEVHLYTNGKEFFDYIIRRMGEATKGIDDISYAVGEPEQTPDADKAYNKYRTTIPVVSKNIPYREVVTFTRDTQAKEVLSTLKKRPFSYSLRYYDFDPEKTPPIIQFMIIDSEEVFFAYYRSPTMSQHNELRLAIKNRALVEVFEDYYKAIWEGAIKVKEGDWIDNATVAQISTKFNIDNNFLRNNSVHNEAQDTAQANLTSNRPTS